MASMTGFTLNVDRDWPEDFRKENGFYSNRCSQCSEFFGGHKRRGHCRKCYNEYAVKSFFEGEIRALWWKEPFGTLMTYGKVETRVWDTKYRGWVLLPRLQEDLRFR